MLFSFCFSKTELVPGISCVLLQNLGTTTGFNKNFMSAPVIFHTNCQVFVYSAERWIIFFDKPGALGIFYVKFF